MDHQKMLKGLKAGKKPIDLSIQKWINIRDGKGDNQGCRNCACCYTSNGVHDCTGCAIDAYEKTFGRFREDSSMCCDMDTDNSKRYIAFMRKVRRWMIKEGTY